MKKKTIFIIVIGAIIIMFIFSGCSKPFVPPTGMTAEETVQFYFEQWNNKNDKAGKSVIREGLRVSGGTNPALVYVKLTKCVDETEKHLMVEGGYYARTYPGYAEFAIVEVEFEIEYKKRWFFDDSSGFPWGKTNVPNWSYTLGKKDTNSDWEIINWGAC